MNWVNIVGSILMASYILVVMVDTFRIRRLLIRYEQFALPIHILSKLVYYELMPMREAEQHFIARLQTSTFSMVVSLLVVWYYAITYPDYLFSICLVGVAAIVNRAQWCALRYELKKYHYDIKESMSSRFFKNLFDLKGDL